MSIQILFPSLFSLRVACFLSSFFIVVFCWLTAQRQRAQWYTNEWAVNEKSSVIIKSSWKSKFIMVYFDRTKFIIYQLIWSLSTTVQSVLMFWFFFRKYTIFLLLHKQKKHTWRMTHAIYAGTDLYSWRFNSVFMRVVAINLCTVSTLYTAYILYISCIKIYIYLYCIYLYIACTI